MTRLLYDVCVAHLREQRMEKERVDALQRAKGQDVLDLFVKGALDGISGLGQCHLDTMNVGPRRYIVRFWGPKNCGYAISSTEFTIAAGELDPAWDDCGWHAESNDGKASHCCTFLDAVIFVLGITLDEKPQAGRPAHAVAHLIGRTVQDVSIHKDQVYITTQDDLVVVLQSATEIENHLSCRCRCKLHMNHSDRGMQPIYCNSCKEGWATINDFLEWKKDDATAT